MKIAIVSDSHGRQAAVREALAVIRARRVDTVIHCGDIGDPATVELFRGLSAHFVYGNCDDDRAALAEAAEAIGATWHGAWGYLELGSKRLAFLHGDDASRFTELEASGTFDYLFHGHTHAARDVRTGTTRIVNPGALHRARPKTFVILDLATGAVESIVVGERT